jgi:iron donor protein CyaY
VYFEGESEYRQSVRSFFDTLQKTVDARDPDEAECEINQGTLRLTFASGHRLILSQQPSVQEIWLAIEAEAKGIHYKFNGKHWVDALNHTLESEIASYYFKETNHTLKEFS